MARKRGLGSKGKSTLGISELIGGSAAAVEAAIAVSPEDQALDTGGEQVRALPVSQCLPGRYQPRRVMDDGALEELAASIKEQGVIAPIVVRPTGADQYEIIAGERRWRASQKAGLTTVPAVVRPLTDQAAMVVGLIENIQREQLNALEEAAALSRLMLEFKLTHEAVSEAVGKSRTAVTNSVRLLQLAAGAKTLLETGKISAGHARALLALPKELQSSFATKVANDKLSVRQTEHMVQKYLAPEKKEAQARQAVDPDVKALEQKLCDRLATKVSLKYDKQGRGSVSIRFESLNQLDDIIAALEVD